jgi:tRNA pseudouridine synthase 10
LREPKTRTIDLKKLEEIVNNSSNGKVEVQDLKYTYRKRKAEIKVSSPDTYKVYRAEVELDDEIKEEDLIKLDSLDLIEQRTPNRVSHRRADKIRKRRVFNIESEFIDSKHIILTIKGQGGLYIKELISSDEGRSSPSVSSTLGVNALCTQLDVIEVGK